MKWINFKVFHSIILIAISVIGLFFTIELALHVWPNLFDFVFVPLIFLPLSIFIREYDRRLVRLALAFDLVSLASIFLFMVWMI